MAGRRLDAEERALWARVAATVTPLAGKARPSVAAADGGAKPPPKPIAIRPTLPEAPKRSPRAQDANTLDGGWDKRLTRGAVIPDLSIDLHGHTLASAHAALDRGLEDAIIGGARVLLLVTGKPPRGEGTGRGAIRAAVGDWLAASRHSASIAAVRNAHPRHGGAGALYIILRRRRT